MVKCGFRLSLEEAEAEAGLGLVGRPHIARVLVASGQIKSIAAAFMQYLGAGKPGDAKAYWPSIEQAIGWIKGAGGVAVVAHPLKYKMTLTKQLNME